MSDNEQLIDMAHGLQESIKMKLLDWIQQGTDPYDILYSIAQELEKDSGERGYAQHIIDNIHTIYGIALENKKPLQDEINDIQARIQRIKTAQASGNFSDEEVARMEFAIKAHQRKTELLQNMLESKSSP